MMRDTDQEADATEDGASDDGAVDPEDVGVDGFSTRRGLSYSFGSEAED